MSRVASHPVTLPRPAVGEGRGEERVGWFGCWVVGWLGTEPPDYRTTQPPTSPHPHLLPQRGEEMTSLNLMPMGGRGDKTSAKVYHYRCSEKDCEFVVTTSVVPAGSDDCL